jgi:hypothetical protein
MRFEEMFVCEYGVPLYGRRVDPTALAGWGGEPLLKMAGDRFVDLLWVLYDPVCSVEGVVLKFALLQAKD